MHTYDFTEYGPVQEVYPHGYHKTDKQGRPVYYERLGQLNITRLFEISTPERMVRHYMQSYEVLMKLRFPACSEVAGKKIEQGLNILDMTGGSVTTVNKQVYGLIKLAAKVGSDYYPEIMGATLIVNAPMVFSGVWAIVKGFIDEKTRKKFKIVGSSYRTTMLEFIDEHNIPSFLGGKCECAEHGGCMKSNEGPWNDYEIVEPKGVKKRAKHFPFINGRPVFLDAAGNPIMKVTEDHAVGHMASHFMDGIEETKEQPKGEDDEDQFFDAEDKEGGVNPVSMEGAQKQTMQAQMQSSKDKGPGAK